MRKALPLTILLLAISLFAATDGQWMLQSSTISYSASHPLHHFDGVSRAARGKGECHTGECQFLIAAPVKSFNSGDSNRDLHMLQVTRGGQFPMVMVRTQFPESEIKPGTIHADLQVQFAGQTAEFKQISFQVTEHGRDIELTGTIPATLTDFKIPSPTLLTIPIKNEIPVHVDMTWSPAK